MRLAVATLFLTAIAAAQNAEPLAFDVASVKPNHSGESGTHIGHDGGTLTINNATLKYCILRAYGVADAQVSGPAWLDTERYDIMAKATADAAHDQHALRLRTLLAERFQMKVHRETRETSVYALVVAKNGPRFKPVETEHSGEGGIASGPGKMTATAVTMSHFVSFLAGPRAALGRVVIDRTGLDGAYSFTLTWSPENDRPRGPDAPPALLSALQEQLGLKAEVAKAPVEMLIIDSVNKLPTEN